MSRRVVITGLGAITPIGNSVDDFYAGIKEGRIGLDNISKFDTSDFRVKIAAEVKDFAPENYMDKKAARRMEPFCQYAVAAAGEAIRAAGLVMEQEDPYRVGCAIGSGIGSLQAMERERIVRVLSECMGSREKAAAKLGISKTTLWRKLRQYQII